MNIYRSIMIVLLSVFIVGFISLDKTNAQHGTCSSYGGVESLCNADSDCYYCSILGVYGCLTIEEECLECSDLTNQNDCDNDAIYGCYWCGNKQKCLKDDESCTCGDGFLQSDEECDTRTGENCLDDCTCPEGMEPDGIKGCKSKIEATNLNQIKTYTEGDASVTIDDIVVTHTTANTSDTITAVLTLTDTSSGSLTALSGNGELYDSGTGIWAISSSLSYVNAALIAVSFTPVAGNNTDITITTHIEGPYGTGPSDGVISITKNKLADIAVTKTVDNPEPRLEDDVVFTILVKNNGPDDAVGVEITDRMPNGLTYKSSTPTQGSYSEDTGVWDVGSVPNSETATLQITSSLTQTGEIVNVAEQTSSSISIFDTDDSNDTGKVTITCNDDDDGVTALMEDGSPNGGDGNGDDILDSLQANVTSIPSATGNGYITVESSSACNQNHDVSVLTGTDLQEDVGYNYPLGLVAFNFPCSPVTVTIYFHNTNSFDTGMLYRKFGPTPDDWDLSLWYTLQGVITGTTDIGGSQVPYVQFELNAGELGDDTPELPIIDQGGPGWPNPSYQIPTFEQYGMIIFMILLALSGVIVLRYPHRIKNK